MRRRELLVGLGMAGAGWPGAASAQTSIGLPLVIGLFVVPLATRLHVTDAFRRGMLDHGCVENRNLRLSFRSAEERPERLAALVASAVAETPDVIVTWGTEPVRAVQRATRTIPIVMAAIGDPVGAGIVTSLARPDSNITGFSMLTTDTSAKRIQLLRELLPELRRFAFLWNPDNKSVATQFQRMIEVAGETDMELLSAEARQPEDIDPALDRAARSGAQAIVSTNDQLFAGERDRLARASMRHRIALIGSNREFAEAGAVGGSILSGRAIPPR